MSQSMRSNCRCFWNVTTNKRYSRNLTSKQKHRSSWIRSRQTRRTQPLNWAREPSTLWVRIELLLLRSFIRQQLLWERKSSWWARSAKQSFSTKKCKKRLSNLKLITRPASAAKWTRNKTWSQALQERITGSTSSTHNSIFRSTRNAATRSDTKKRLLSSKNKE